MVKGGKGMNAVADVALGGLVGIFVFLFGDWTLMLQILVAVLVMELLTGLAKGIYNSNLNSKIFSRGLIKKGLIFLVIILAHFVDVITGAGSAFMTLAILYYIGVEGISIIENLSQMGIPIPEALRKKFEQLRNDNDNEK